MSKSQAERTTADNLEAKFDRREDVLDYVDIRKAKVVRPKPGTPSSLIKKQSGGSDAVKREPADKAVVREAHGDYPARRKSAATKTRK